MTELWTMPNGLRVVAEKLPWLRSVSVGVWLHVGSLWEKPEENGLSHLIEHMVFKGTENRTTRQIAEETDAMGGQVNAFTARDCTCFYAKVIDEELPEAVSLLSDLVLHARMDPGELERERGVVLEEIAMDEDDPEDLCGELLNRAQFGDTPAGRPIIGTAELVRAYTDADLRRFRDTHYVPSRAVIALSGNYDRKQVEDLIGTYFGAWRGDDPQAAVGPQTVRGGMRSLREKDTEQTHLMLGYPGYVYGDDRNMALTILNTIFGGAMSSRLFQRIREELGMAYSVYTFPGSLEGIGTFGIYAGVNPRNAERVLAEIHRGREALIADGVTEKEFREAKRQLRTGFLMSLESQGARMNAMGRRLLILNKTRTEEEVLASIEAVTREDVCETARQLLTADPCLAAVGRGVEALG